MGKIVICMLFAVVKYFNYRKSAIIETLKIFTNFHKANDYALNCADKEFGNEIRKVDNFSLFVPREIHVKNVVESYTTNHGYNEWVFAVIYFTEE